MPDTNGLEFVNKVPGEQFKDIPVLVVTTHSIKEDIIKAMRAGVNSCIIKPYYHPDLEIDDRLDIWLLNPGVY